MRNGNSASSLYLLPECAFLSYLWGMETQYSYYHVLFVHFRSYPTYEEWKHSSSDLFSPMSSSSSYPTYEEWKLCQTGILFQPIPLFLSYLWGMETILQLPYPTYSNNHRSYPTYEEWKLEKWINIFCCIFIVLILPMRNGNNFPLSWAKCNMPAWFLSYLWGMETFSYSIYKFLRCFRSYPTYEEWKHLIAFIFPRMILRSYPTYEEWKPNSPRCKPFVNLCSYPTYE